jgi:hypothetical protein
MRFLSVLLLIGIAALASAVDTIPKIFGEVRTRAGAAQSGARVLVTLTGTGTNATLYADDESTTKINPLTTDSNGGYAFKVAPGAYDITVSLNGTVIDQRSHYQVTSPTASVSSIALTMPAEFSVAGSPVTTAGTFVVTEATQSANTFYAGPTTGAAAAPGYRAVVPADLTAALLIPPAIGTTTPAAGKFTTLAASGQFTSTIATGTAPFAVASTTQVANLYAARAALADTVTTDANLTGVITSVGNATSIASQTGTGTKFVVDTSPTLVTPVLGAATATSITSGSFTDSGLTSGRVTFASTAGLLADSASLVTDGTALAAGGAIQATFVSGTVTPRLQALGTTGNVGVGILRTNAATTAGGIYFGKSRSGTIGTPGVITTGDSLGSVVFSGDDGTNLVESAKILVVSEGTIGTGVIPGRIREFTSNSAGTSVQGYTMDSSQTSIFSSASASSGLFSGGTITPRIQTGATSPTGASANGSISMSMFSASAANACSLFLTRAHSGSLGTMTVVTTGDTLGGIDWQGADGTNFVSSAQIVGLVEGTVGAAQLPGRLRFNTANSAGTLATAFTIDSQQCSIFANIQTSTGLSTLSGGTITPRVQVWGNSSTTSSSGTIMVGTYLNGTNGPTIFLAKSRAGTVGQNTVVTTGDTLGTISFQGADGTNYAAAATIIVTATGTVGAAQIPGNMVIQTASTAGTLTTAITVDNAQKVAIAKNITIGDTTNATTAATGADVNSGGLGVAKNIIAGFGMHEGVASTATAAGTTTLTATSLGVQIFTGATTQTVQLPAANLFGAGISVTYTLINRSSGSVSWQRAGSDTINGATSTVAVTSNTASTIYSDGVSAWYTK